MFRRRDIHFEEATLLSFVSLLSRGQLLKERICSYRSKFFPLRVDPIPKRPMPIQRSKQKFMQVYVILHPEKRRQEGGGDGGGFVRPGAFIMPPTSKKLKGHIGLGLSVCPSDRLSV